MIEIHRSALVLVPSHELYNLINDIEAYPQFLDGVAESRVLSASPTEMVGELLIRKAGIERRLVTRNRLTAPERIEMTLEDGPLDSLEGVWSIQSLNEQGCKVSLDLSFSAGRGLKSFTFNRVFKQVADSMVNAFVERAHALSR
ncbi:type II toxin-antitoxin system RatA family toxin [Reinekea blandensis]|uniref:Streptomyces cyclase/dehydrase n=1 Tax=Reinekea blandensis MED297 TaxID=314283 RepID=A4BK66_9GAMM|nr:type II toxin-antitoxin system RatA family toxin [Reinekea blandensis]EAR07495.1 Streptomyces cyclase/dehydrase [Reinekea sp. MED297] [Reinekea blandensis MED297]